MDEDRIALSADEGPAYVAMNAQRFQAYQRWLRINGLKLFPVPEAAAVLGSPVYAVMPADDAEDRRERANRFAERIMGPTPANLGSPLPRLTYYDDDE